MDRDSGFLHGIAHAAQVFVLSVQLAEVRITSSEFSSILFVEIMASYYTAQFSSLLKLPEESAIIILDFCPKWNIDKVINSVFRMYAVNAERIPAELLCENAVMDAMIDRFGKNVKTKAVDEGHFTAEVSVAVNDVFFGWIFGFGGKVKIIGPEDVKARYVEMVQNAAKEL